MEQLQSAWIPKLTHYLILPLCYFRMANSRAVSVDSQLQRLSQTVRLSTFPFYVAVLAKQVLGNNPHEHQETHRSQQHRFNSIHALSLSCIIFVAGANLSNRSQDAFFNRHSHSHYSEAHRRRSCRLLSSQRSETTPPTQLAADVSSPNQNLPFLG